MAGPRGGATARGPRLRLARSRRKIRGTREPMPTFQYANPSTIHWGPGCVRERLPDEVARIGARRVLVVTTRSVAEDPRLAPAVEAALGDRFAGRFAAVSQHTPARAIMEAVEAARSARADALVSVGGGSPIDAAKAAAFSLATGLD